MPPITLIKQMPAGQMISERQQAYLDAMGVEVWALRESAQLAEIEDDSPISADSNLNNSVTTDTRLKIGSGNGGVLLICAVDADSASRLANDLTRALGSVPVWAWPDDEPAATELACAVDEKLFTTVAIFGDDLAGQFCEGTLSDAVSSARLVLLPSMQELETRADARRSLWDTFCRTGLVAKREQQT